MDRTEPNGVSEITPERDKAIRLFTYLKDLCALRTTQVRDVKAFDQVFWLTDLPHHKLCRSAIWRLTDSSSPTTDQHVDTWIEIRKPALKSPPELPDELEPWIKDEELTDSSLSEPGFYEQIPLSALLGDSDNTEPNVLVSINTEVGSKKWTPSIYDLRLGGVGWNGYRDRSIRRSFESKPCSLFRNRR